MDMAIRLSEELLIWKCSAAATSISLRAPPKLWIEIRMCEIAEFQAISTPITIRELTNGGEADREDQLTTPIAKHVLERTCQRSDPDGVGRAHRRRQSVADGRDHEPDREHRQEDESAPGVRTL